MCSPTRPKGTGNAVNAFFLAGERYQNPYFGYNGFDMPTECGTFQESDPDHWIVSAAEIRPELMPRKHVACGIRLPGLLHTR